MWLRTILFFSCLAVCCSAASADLLKLKLDGLTAAVAKADLGRSVILDVKPSDLEKRLKAEDVLSEYNLAKKITSNLGTSQATAFRDLITSSSTQKITSSLAGNDINSRLGELNTTARAAIVGNETRIETLPIYSANVGKSFDDESIRSGLLRVWEGAPVKKPDPYPDAVLVVGNNKLCTGSLISEEHVISAAHCLCSGVSKEILVATSFLDYAYRAEIDIGQSASFIPCNELNNDLSKVSSGDIAVLKLRQKIPGVPTRKIATDQSFRAAASVRAVGFGKTNDAYFGAKFTVDIVIASYDCTEQNFSGSGPYGCAAGREMIAAGMNRDTCGGDSGGPIYVLGADLNLYLAAVTSRSVNPRGGCGQGGIYVKLMDSNIKSWLVQQGISVAAFEQ